MADQPPVSSMASILALQGAHITVARQLYARRATFSSQVDTLYRECLAEAKAIIAIEVADTKAQMEALPKIEDPTTPPNPDTITPGGGV